MFESKGDVLFYLQFPYNPFSISFLKPKALFFEEGRVYKKTQSEEQPCYV